MARIRTIKPEFWVSAQVAECSTNARLLFVGLWTFSDDQGVHPASLKQVKMEVFPGDSFTPEEIREWIAELLAVGLLAEFTVPADSTQDYAGKTFWFVTGWHHQRIDKPSNKYPRPEEFLDRSQIVLRTFQDHSFCKGKESKGKESTIDESSPLNPPRGKFVEPTLQEVLEYCQSRGNGIDADQFVDFYTSKGWMVGKNKMRSWQAAIRTWEKNKRESENGKAKTPEDKSIEEFKRAFDRAKGGRRADP